MAATQIRLPDITMAKLKIIAEKQDRSLNAQMKSILEKFITDYEKVNGEIKITESR